MCQIIDYWRQLEINNGESLIHPADSQILENVNQVNLDFANYIGGNCDNLFGDNFQLHTRLIPVPYSGDIRNARIYLLMINPGFHHNDYYSENHCQNYRNALINSLRQEEINDDFPFHYLNPEFCHTSGGNYWFKKFNDIIIQLTNNVADYSYRDSIRLISRNICTLELFPYHSINFGLNQQIINDCSSINQIRRFVNQLLNGQRDILIECLRQPGNWGLNEIVDDRLHILPPQLRQSISFNPANGLGARIFNKLVEIANEQ
ncbi:MAG: hypothetical protein ACOXZU_08135 [Bacteroidales bacterium]|jgi:hypothetical protein